MIQKAALVKCCCTVCLWYGLEIISAAGLWGGWWWLSARIVIDGFVEQTLYRLESKVLQATQYNNIFYLTPPQNPLLRIGGPFRTDTDGRGHRGKRNWLKTAPAPPSTRATPASDPTHSDAITLLGKITLDAASWLWKSNLGTYKLVLIYLSLYSSFGVHGSSQRMKHSSCPYERDLLQSKIVSALRSQVRCPSCRLKLLQSCTEACGNESFWGSVHAYT